jgi:hypothetical protein
MKMMELLDNCIIFYFFRNRTMEAMKGGMDFRQALAIRLDLIRPTSAQLRNFIYGQKHRLTPYVK